METGFCGSVLLGAYLEVEKSALENLPILERGSNGEAYNVVNEASTMTIRQMAELEKGCPLR